MSIKLQHSGGNSVSLNPPTSAPTSSEVAFRLPTSDGTAGQVLQTDGSGNLSWVSLGHTLLGSCTLAANFASNGSDNIVANLTFNTTGYQYLYGKVYNISRSGSTFWNDLGLRWNGSSSAVYDYTMRRMHNDGNGSTRNEQGGNQFFINAGGLHGQLNNTNTAVFYLHMVNDGKAKPFYMIAHAEFGTNSQNESVLETSGAFNSTSAITSLQLYAHDTTINGGTLELYGVK